MSVNQETGDMLEALAGDMSALSNPQRLRLLQMITKPQYGNELAQALGLTRPAILKHIRKLESHGFVKSLHGRRESGPVVEYQVVPQRLFAVSVAIGNLGRLEPEGGPQRRIVEATVLTTEDSHRDEAAAKGLAPRLVVVNGPRAGEECLLDGAGPRWTIGRDDDRTIALKHDPFISNRHCELQVDPSGHALVDAHSTNGTMLNFHRVPTGGRLPLCPGDIIGVGHTCLVFQQPAAVAEL